MISKLENNNTSDIYDFNSICVLCECPERVHSMFFNCPLFSGEKICQEDCLISFLKNDVAQRVSQRLGKEMTLDQINEICKSCGKNYAKQNDELGRKLERENL